MAIYSLRLTPIGKTTQKRPFTAAAHIRYITRKEAVTQVLAARMPETRREAVRWLRTEEVGDRANARVADKLVLALPVELSSEQHAELVRTFAEGLTRGRASWFAAIHAKGKDVRNPHCHLLIRDRDVATGRRVVMFSAGPKEVEARRAKGAPAPTTLRDIRSLWEKVANDALARSGTAARIDARSLIDQGSLRSPQIHEGPNVRAMHARGAKPTSQDRVYRNPVARKKGTPATRLVAYAKIDSGLTRVEYNLALQEQPEMSLTEFLRRQDRMQRATPVQSDRDRAR